jgi:hypothetical protein
MNERYEIRVQGLLDAGWADWLGGMDLRHERGRETVLTGAVPDQAYLHGLLARIRDLNLTLIAVNRIGPGRPARETD